MPYYRVNVIHAFPDPRWMNKVRSGEHKGVAVTATRVMVEGELLELHEPEAIQLLPEEEIYLSVFFGWFRIERGKDHDARIQTEKEKKEREERQSYENANRRRDEAIAFNNSFDFPFKADSGYKAVLSGLTENSWGDGFKSNTVIHILVLESFKSGRIKREERDFLCSSSWKQNGKRWVEPIARSYDGDGKEYPPKYDCAACLKRASKWKKSE